ncbi:MAG: DUF4411 family protein [Alphaproteobacteria bacterium]|nr:DUF4411 family protein [Alphaproteobacteria bacterium]
MHLAREALRQVLYLLDANVLIDANRDYYSIDRVPEFWGWLHHHGEQGNVAVPLDVYEEIREGNDALATWSRSEEFRENLLFAEEVDPELVARVVDEGYAADLTEDQVEELGRDPFLIAYGLVDPVDRCIVTTERSRPHRQRHNRHVPDVCNSFGINSLNTFEFTRELDFRTDWQPG